MLSRLRLDVTGQLMHVVLAQTPPEEFTDMGELPAMQAHHMDPMTGEDEFDERPEPVQLSRQERRAAARQTNGAAAARKPAPARASVKPGSKPVANPSDPSSWGKVSRNAPCPCGSGKKFKHCHGAIASAAAE
jgi:preprotein translocase subunit SecA